MIDPTVYLAGYIAGEVLDKCREWREFCKQEEPTWNWIDPLTGKDLSSITPDGCGSSIPHSVIFARDFQSVSRAHMLLGNIDTFGCVRPPLGTYSEIAWSYVQRKPVLLLSTDQRIRQHPFITGQAAFVGSTVPEIMAMARYIALGL